MDGSKCRTLRPFPQTSAGPSGSGRDNVRMELYNVFNRSYWYDPTGTALTNFKQLQTRLPNGITSAGFGRVLATAGTFFGNTANLAPRQGLLVARITF